MADQVKPQQISPLPLGSTGNVQPLNTGAPNVPAAQATTQNDAIDTSTQSTDTQDPVSQWLDANPNFDGAQATDPNAVATATTEPRPTDATAATDAATTATQTDATAAGQQQTTTTTTDPQATATASTTDPNAATTTQPQQQPKTYAPDEKFGLADGVEWTREQILAGLRERAQLQPQAKEAQQYRQLFGMSVEDAQKNWGPIIERLAKEPKTTAFLDDYLTNGDKALYLEACAAHYDSLAGGGAQAQQQTTQQQTQTLPSQPTDLEREVASLREWRQQQDQRDALDRVNREFAQATAKYPFLATDENLRNDLILTAKALAAQDPTKGILDALALKASIYDAISIARVQQTQTADTTAATTTSAATPQPALLGSPGASPGGTRPANNGRPKTFDSADDAVEDWLNNPPQRFE